jgi:hypothetical protein
MACGVSSWPERCFHRYATRRDNQLPFAIKCISKALCAGKEDMIEMELEVLRQVLC